MLVRAVILATEGDKDPERSMLVKFLNKTGNHK